MTRRENGWLALFAALLLAPAFSAPRLRLGLPRVWEGDEPHYLVAIHSLIEDGDLDLADDYVAAARGGGEAGVRWAGKPLDHHIAWWKAGRRIGWAQAFDVDARRWTRDEEGHPRPSPAPGFAEDLAGLPERSSHPPGVPLLISALVWPLRASRWVEPAAVLVAALFMIGAMLLFHRLVRSFGSGLHAALAVTALAFLGTPAWHHSRSLFNEGFLLFFVVAAYWLVLRTRRGPLLAGILIGLGMLMKPPFGLVLLPLVALLSARRRWRDALLAALPCALATAAVLALNAHLHGSPWRSAQDFSVGSPLKGALGLLLDPRHGLLAAAPVALLAALGWPALLRRERAESLTVLAGFGAYFALMAVWSIWWGGWCYGPRLILPVLPLFMLGLAGFGLPAGRRWRAVAAALAVASLALNARAAFVYWRAYRNEPLLFTQVGGTPRPVESAASARGLSKA